MSQTLLPYKSYLDSEVDWLGAIPEEWHVSQIRRTVEEHRQGYYSTDEYTDIGVPLIRITDLGAYGKVDSSECPRLPFASDMSEFYLNSGDFVFARTGGAGSFGIIEEVSEPMIYASYLIRFRFSQKLNGTFLKYYFLSEGFREGIAKNIHGGVNQNIHAEDIKNQWIAIPPLFEQSVISNFLDAQTQRIDALVREQDELILLLKEKRQVLISHAVTKGLDPNAKMKPSGVEWIGDIPEGWNVVRIATLFSEVNEEGIDGLPILSVSIHDGVSDKELNEEELDRKVTRSEDRAKYKRVKVDDLVYNMMRAWQGGFGAVKLEGMVSPAYVVARPRMTFLTSFIEKILRTPQAIEELRTQSRGITDFRLRLYWDEFKSVKIAVPSIQEQFEIMKFCESESLRIDALIAEAEATIVLMQEHRSALISAVVTGKVRAPA